MINNAFFEKTIGHERKHRYIKLLTTGRRRDYLVSEPNYHTTIFFTESFLAIERNKAEILMNKPVCLGLSILKLNKILMYEFCHDCVKLKYSKKEHNCVIWIVFYCIYQNRWYL